MWYTHGWFFVLRRICVTGWMSLGDLSSWLLGPCGQQGGPTHKTKHDDSFSIFVTRVCHFHTQPCKVNTFHVDYCSLCKGGPYKRRVVMLCS